MSFSGQEQWVLDKLWYSQQQQTEREQAQARSRIREEKRSRAAAAERAAMRGIYLDAFKAELAKQQAKPLPPMRQTQRTEWIPAPKQPIKQTSEKPMSKSFGSPDADRKAYEKLVMAGIHPDEAEQIIMVALEARKALWGE